MTAPAPSRDDDRPGANPPSTRRAPRYPAFYRRLWIPMAVVYLVWTPLLGAMLYVRLVHNLPTVWYVPILIALILGAIVPGAVVTPIWFARLQRRINRAEGMLCPNCLYDLRSIPDPERCPECGWSFEGSTPPEIWARTLNRRTPYEPPRPSPPDREG